MINLENNSGKTNQEEGKKDYYEGISTGIHRVFINDLYINKSRFKEEEYEIMIDVTINNRQFKYVRFTPFRLTHEMIYNPSKKCYQLTDVINKIKQIIYNLYRKNDIKTLKSPDIISAIDEIKQIGSIKGNAYMYLELNVTKSGYKYLSIPPAFRSDVVISSIYDEIRYTPPKKDADKKEDTSDLRVEEKTNDIKQKVDDDSDLPI